MKREYNDDIILKYQVETDDSEWILQAVICDTYLILKHANTLKIINLEDNSVREIDNGIGQVKFINHHSLWCHLGDGSMSILDINTLKTYFVKLNGFEDQKVSSFCRFQNTILFLIKNKVYEALNLSNELSIKDECFMVSIKESETITSKSFYCTAVFNNKPVTVSVGSNINTLKVMCPFTNLSKNIKTTFNIKNVETLSNNEFILCEENRFEDKYVNLRKLSAINEVVSSNTVNKTCKLVDSLKENFVYLTIEENTVEVHYAKKKKEDNIVQALANNGQYDEAAEYALKNNIDINSVLKMRFSNIVQSILKNDLSVDIDVLIKLIDKLDDMYWILKQCTQLCKFSSLYRPLLNCLLSKVTDKKIYESIVELISKLDICDYLQKVNMLECLDVHVKSLPELCIYFLAREEIEIAIFIWVKYVAVFNSVSIDDAVTILNATPSNLKLSGLKLWLANFLPGALLVEPFFVDAAVKWVIEKTINFEKTKFWPEIGLTFLDDVLFILDQVNFPFVVQFPSVQSLHKLHANISDLKVLKTKYSINILLTELSVSNPADLLKLVLQRAYTEDIGAIVDNWIAIEAARAELDLESILLEYLEHEAFNKNIGDARIIVILKCMKNLEVRHAALNSILPTLPVPWSEDILKESEFAIKENHCHSRNIKVQLEYSKLRLIAKKYNFSIESFTDDGFILKMLKSSLINLNDIETIMQIIGKRLDNVMVLFLQKCFEDNNTELALTFFHSLNQMQVQLMSKQLEWHILCAIQEEAHFNIINNYFEFAKITEALQNHQIEHLQDLFILKRHFNIDITNFDYFDTENKQAIFVKWCNDSSINNITEYYEKSLYLAHILKLDQNHIHCSIFNSRTNQEALFMFDKMTQANISTEHFSANAIIHCMNDKLILDRCLKHAFKNVVLSNENEDWILKLNTHFLLNNIRKMYVSNNLISPKYQMISNVLTNRKNPDNLLALLLDDRSLIKQEYLKAVTQKDIKSVKLLMKYKQVSIEKGLDCHKFNMLVNEFSKKIATQILLSPFIDELFATVVICLMEDPEKWLEKLFSEFINNYDNDNDFALSTFASKNIFYHHKTMFESLRKLSSKYGLKNLPVDGENFAEHEPDFALLQSALISKSDISDECLFYLCEFLKIPSDDGFLMLALRMLCDSNCTDSSSDVSLFKVIFRICENIKDKRLLIESLKQLWNTGCVHVNESAPFHANPYDYNVYLCIYKLISHFCKDWKQPRLMLILHFLDHYERKGPNKWEETVTYYIGESPKWVSKRLPFPIFLTNNLWDVLKAEITLETYKFWLPIAELLGINPDSQTVKDMLCSNAVKQSMTAAANHTRESASVQWNLHITDQMLLKKAHQAVKCISNMEWAVACLFYVLTGCSSGADKLAAAHLCYELACCWATTHPAHNAVNRLKAEYARLSTMHALNILGLSNKKYSDAVSLIKEIYLNDYKKITFPQANKIIEEIAEANCINISSLRVEVLESIMNRKDTRLAKDDLSCLIWLLRSTCTTASAIYLNRIAFDEMADTHKSKKLKAVQCLISLIDYDMLSNVANTEPSRLWFYALETQCKIALENSQLSYVVPAFTENKAEAVDMMWQSGDINKAEISTITNIILSFNVCTKYINEIITKLLNFGLNDEAIRTITQCGHTVSRITYRKVWESLLISTFEKLKYPLSESQIKKSARSISLLATCNFREDLNISDFMSKCLDVKCPELAYLFAMFTNEPLACIQKHDVKEIFNCLKKISAETFIGKLNLKIFQNVQ